MPPQGPPARDIAVGANVRSARMEGGLSRERLAGRLGVEASVLAAVERGVLRADPDLLERLSRALAVPVRTLLDGVPVREACALRPLHEGDEEDPVPPRDRAPTDTSHGGSATVTVLHADRWTRRGGR